jgi:hypothetical protein
LIIRLYSTQGFFATNSEILMADIDLSQKFPDMQPLRAMPSLSQSKGFGMHLVGRRGYDEETHSYIKTLCFCLLYIPIIAVRAYRLIDNPGGGWYLLGRVPLSRGARIGNVSFIVAVLAVAGGFGWHHYTHTPDYIAAQRIEEADHLASEGKARQAAEIYRDEMGKPTKHAGTARAKLRGLIEAPPAALEEAAGVFRIALDLQRHNDPLVPDLFDRGAKLAEVHVNDDPKGALAVVETVSPLAPKPQAVLALRQKLLERIVEADPGDIAASSRLAVVYEAQGDVARCERLLTPLADRLADQDGAAILGRIRADKGALDAAYGLLRPYVNARLWRLRQATQAYESAMKRVESQVFSELQQNKATGFDYAAYDNAPPARQRTMVTEYLSKRVAADAEVRAARDSLDGQAHVVGASLNLGMVLLQRAQQRNDPAVRKQELEEAEKVFIDIRGIAGESEAYRINLGQVTIGWASTSRVTRNSTNCSPRAIATLCYFWPSARSYAKSATCPKRASWPRKPTQVRRTLRSSGKRRLAGL